MRWTFYEGTYVDGVKVQTELSGAGDFTISHRPSNFNVSYRPPGHHVHVGCYATLEAAKAAAEAYVPPAPIEGRCREAGCTALHAD